jgi:type II secretory pathway component PulC
LRPTDVVTSINGMPLNDPTSLVQLQDLLKELQPFSVTLMRNGQEQTLDVQP